ncbi:MAG: SGNH/GDSL hydrolase family protein [Dysgonamonadaceae bacterium]|nr:SGNH/GDSL hydrolase family protein [Dysgonamonadaceae bacterium]MDD4728460.1 SGNH/GDSL hydrolase family protein [Dysgonamonadaceae bacterium]
MKQLRFSFLLTAFLLINSFLINSQVVYYDATHFPLLGKITDETETKFERLPCYLKGNVSRPAIWSLGKNTSGLAIRFRSNTTSVSAKWEVLQNISMNHFTETGIKGLDLYTWENNKWQFVNTARPKEASTQQSIISNMTPQEREFMLFLPLYDGVKSLSIGVDSTSTMTSPQTNYPTIEHPIVVYGTSITQGGCATRPGMSYTNILMRWMNREFINLGFSGNGKLDYEIAEVMAKRNDAGMFVLDFIPNVDISQIKERTKHFVKIIRKENPETPILFVESIVYPHSVFDVNIANYLIEKNKALLAEFNEISMNGDKNVYYLKSDGLIGDDGEGTIDGVHLTDLGFQRFARVIMDKIQSILP